MAYSRYGSIARLTVPAGPPILTLALQRLEHQWCVPHRYQIARDALASPKPIQSLYNLNRDLEKSQPLMPLPHIFVLLPQNFWKLLQTAPLSMLPNKILSKPAMFQTPSILQIMTGFDEMSLGQRCQGGTYFGQLTNILGQKYKNLRADIKILGKKIRI